MTFWNWVTRKRTDRGWPGYIVNGRIRTSTAGLIVAFFAIAWLHNAYQPPAPTPTAPETAQVVPPGFMPDPEYTWVPRTNVETPSTTTTTTTTPTTTTTTTEPSPTETTSSTDTTSATTTTDAAPTTVIDPDGAGPLPPITLPPGLPLPNRSGTTTATTATVLPGQLPATTVLPPPG
jgi:cytoskeletal protein RodZ